MEITDGRVVTSISISPDFNDLIKRFDFSPTEVFRRGVAVMLYDIGHIGYVNELNKKRSEFVKKFFEEYESNKEVNKLFHRIKEFLKEAESFANKNAVETSVKVDK